jgi:hypothetical protein
MVHFEVDPDSLVAAAEVADRQVGHVARTGAYIEDVCGRTGAFSGVLRLFLGSYESALDHARTGMRDSQTVAGKVRDSFRACSEAYVASDRAAHSTFEKVFGDEMSLPPYVAPGSGRTAPGGPSGGPGAAGDGPEDGDPVGLPSAPPWVDEPLGRVVPGPKTDDLPPWLDPRTAAKDAVVRSLHTRADYDAYRALREQGYTAEQAQNLVRPSVEDVADTHVYEQTQARGQQAYDDAYDRAVRDGRSADEAQRLASDARAQQHSDDALDHRTRAGAVDALGTYKGAYDQVSGLVEHTGSIVEHGQQLEETTDDLGDYDDYEDGAEDRSAQDWATR